MTVNQNMFINGRFLTHKTDGIGRFSLEICKALAQASFDFIVVVPIWVDIDKELPFEIVKYGNRKSHFWEQIDLPAFLRRADNPMLINLSGLGPLFYKNQIITIHDLSFYDHPEWFSLPYRYLYSFATPILAKNAKVIVTVSEFSKKEIIKYLKVRLAKIFVVPNAVSSNVILDEVDGKDNARLKKYILAVSSLDPRKNHKTLIEAFSHPSFNEYELLLVGKSSPNFNTGNLETRNERIKFCGYVSDLELATLYKNAELFIYPSVYEGFGIPPLEAMSNNCAVVVSNIESLKEVCGSAAIYADPLDVTSLRTAMNTVLSNKTLKIQLIEMGKNRASLFSWERSAKELLKAVAFLKSNNESTSNSKIL